MFHGSQMINGIFISIVSLKNFLSFIEALLGAVFCFVIMFLVDYKLAALSFGRLLRNDFFFM